MTQASADSMGERGSQAGTKLKSTAWNGADTFGFTMLPAGLRYDKGVFGNLGEHAKFWTSSNSTDAWGRLLYTGWSGVFRNIYSKVSGFSVRGLEDQ